MSSQVIAASDIGIRAVEKSGNRKLGDCSATWVAQQTCPNGENGTVRCPFLPEPGTGEESESLCYANQSFAGMTTSKLNTTDADAEELARREAEGIRRLTGKRPLRLHVVGDCSSATSARVVSKAADEYHAKAGMPVWTYTHAWQAVARENWGEVSVLASCQTVEETAEAMARGYAASMVVKYHEKDTAYPLGGGITGIPCPEQTGRAKDCRSCGLCHRADKLLAGKKVILFAAHGRKAEQVRRAVER